MKTLTKIQAIITFVAVGIVFVLGTIFAFVPMHWGSKDYESFLRVMPVSQEIAGGMSAIYTVDDKEVAPEKMEIVVDKLGEIVADYGYENVYVSQLGDNKIRVDISEEMLTEEVSQTTEFLKGITTGQLVLSTASKFETESTETALVYKLFGSEHIESIEKIQSSGQFGIQINLNKAGKAVYEQAYKDLTVSKFYIYVAGKAWPNASYNSVDISQSISATGALTWMVGTEDVADYYYNTFVAGTLPVALNTTVETFSVVSTNVTTYLAIALGVLFLALAVLVILRHRILGVFSAVASLISVVAIMFLIQAMPWVEFGVVSMVVAFALVVFTFFVNNIIIENISKEYAFGKSIETSAVDGGRKSVKQIFELCALSAIVGAVLAFGGRNELVAIGTLILTSVVVIALISLFVFRLMISACVALKPNDAKLYALTRGEGLK